MRLLFSVGKMGMSRTFLRKVAAMFSCLLMLKVLHKRPASVPYSLSSAVSAMLLFLMADIVAVISSVPGNWLGVKEKLRSFSKISVLTR